MTNISKLALAPAAAAAALMFLAPAVSAGEKDSIVVSASAMDEFRADTTRALDRNLALAERHTGRNPQSGIVQIRFTLDERGKPTGLKAISNSGGHAALRNAKWAVARLSGLDAAPVRSASRATFQANIVFAENEEEKRSQLAALRSMTRTQLAQADSGAPLVMLGS